MDIRYLILQTGDVFQASSFGSPKEVTAPLVFTTNMVGYLETLTDPSYHGLMVAQTFPSIGNYGVIPADFESNAPALSAYIVKEVCSAPSNFRSAGTLSDYLETAGVVGLCGLDTRALTKIIREHGTMNAAIVKERPLDMNAFVENLRNFTGTSSVFQVTCKETYTLNPQGKHHVVLWDFGFQNSIAQELIRRDCKLSVVPAGTAAAEILALQPDGILLSNGPENPDENTQIIEEIKTVANSGIPLFGICLGHLLLALSQGAAITQLKHGHRGANQPVRHLKTNGLYMTSQNHGYAVKADSLPETAVLTFAHVDDHSCEGIAYTHIPAFSVQFYPTVCNGAQGANFLFDQFIKMMGGN